MRKRKAAPSASSILFRAVVFFGLMFAVYAWASGDPRSQQLWQAWEAHAGNVISR